MNRKTRLLVVASGVVLMLLITLLMVNVTSASINAMAIEGTLTLPAGSLPVPIGTHVILLNPDRSEHGRSMVDVNTGAFSFAGLTPGVYLVRGEPPIGSLTYAPSRIVPVPVVTSNITLPPIALTHPSITGTVYQPDGVTPVSAWVEVFEHDVLVEHRLTNSGDFVIGGLPTGTYKLQAEPLPDQPFWFSHFISVALQPSAAQYITLSLHAAQIAGVVKQGPNPVEGARVHAVASDGRQRWDVTGPQGKFALGDLPNGLQAFVGVEPPIDQRGLIPPPIKVITTPDLSLTFNFITSPKIVTGTVRTNTSVPVQTAWVEAHRIDALGNDGTLSDARGAYTLTLTPGMWAVNVHPISTTIPAHWFVPDPPRVVEFDNTLLPEHKTVNFVVLIADATVNGAVQLPAGGAPPFTVTVALRNDEGLGAAQLLEPSGHFSLDVPHGAYNLQLRVDSNLFAAPPPVSIHARPAANTVPTMTLIARDAILTGTLSDNLSNPLDGIPVIAWNTTTRATFGTRTGSDGSYVLNVYSGTWFVQPAPLPDQPYVFSGDPLSPTVEAGSVTPDQNFTLTVADAMLHGVLLAPDGLPVPAVKGWATAKNDVVKNGAPIENGQFDILAPAGAYSVSLSLPAGQQYMWDGQRQVATVVSGDMTTVTFTLVKKDALFVGAAYDKRAEVSVDVDGHVWAWNDGLWVGTDLKPGGFYALPAPAGLWRLNYSIDPESNYIKASGPRSYGLQAGQVQTVGLPLLRKDGLLTGTVVLTDGVTPARDAIVIAEGISPEINDVTLRAPVGDDGSFALKLPSGLWNVRSARLPDRGLINPVARGVFVPHNGSTSVFLQYRSPNALIMGAVSLSSGDPFTGVVRLYGWTSDDAFNTTSVRVSGDVSGTYLLPVLQGNPWNLVAVYETPNRYWIARAQVPVPGSLVVKNLMLNGPYLKPAPVSVLIDPAEDRSIELDDGTRLFIPAGALPTTERVILHITPLASVPYMRNGNVLGLGYAFEAYTESGESLTDNFNQDVVITFKYNPVEVMLRGLNINRLKPAYFSTTTNSWTRPDSYVVDEDRHTITMQINHFTLFSLVGEEEAGTQVFLPMVVK